MHFHQEGGSLASGAPGSSTSVLGRFELPSVRIDTEGLEMSRQHSPRVFGIKGAAQSKTLGHKNQRRHQTRSTGRGFCSETPQTSQGLWSHTAQPVQKLLPSSFNVSIMGLCSPPRTSPAHSSLLSSSLCSRDIVIPVPLLLQTDQQV